MEEKVKDGRKVETKEVAKEKVGSDLVEKAKVEAYTTLICGGATGVEMTGMAGSDGMTDRCDR